MEREISVESIHEKKRIKFTNNEEDNLKGYDSEETIIDDISNNYESKVMEKNCKQVDTGFKLTVVRDLPLNCNIDCVTLGQLLHLDGELSEVFQFNYMLEIDWFLTNVPNHSKNIPLTFVHGQQHLQLEFKEYSKKFKNLKFFVPDLPILYGTHHTKAMFLFNKKETLRIVIHTANLIERDWRNKTQGVWISPQIAKKTSNSPPSCEFELDLIKYLGNYGSFLDDLRNKLTVYDYCGVKAKLIYSVPGRHKGSELNKYGHLALRKALEKAECEKEVFDDSSLIMQFSSVGSLGKDENWLVNELKASFLNVKNKFMLRNPKLKLIYPTVENVRNNLDGWAGGGSLPFSKENYGKQKNYMKKYLNSWKALTAKRQMAIPHIKTYCRISNTVEDRLGWFLLSSCNLSKAAWGELQKQNTQLQIRSFELGVLLYPELFKNKGNQRVIMHRKNLERGIFCDKDYGIITDNEILIPICLPYDFPLLRYEEGDECYNSNENYGLLRDCFGRTKASYY
ncbi:tyrosyl-DNA phosphodiesterase 1 [Clydaea vesicula]|uniref:Tyrosyl-DNA phosphodiesterase 1 n=1 Tax=Clydaea vesicula TaxID=447962 RepID=A0AAD5UAX4_9FUNG|nr:tyrosyl-DNA phosphodiesterase 1 [Clydaea vesicula]KAJ3393965.1 tyrosyl-DNA phosphodiesterase 1 [Lobulomyces angularis]